ncbi:NAD(P)-dependent alcohol dehydrogenase [Primorskyibacter sp. S187A]|uniref:NAD(P)-dependent alcohol dehydrogenase n=1 Tax=Primorskyibacter sp. S187A TaxID=3415130 RepID=UPI003C7A5818
MDATFTAWDVTRYGGPDVLSPVSRPLPHPAPREVLIRIRASAVTRADGLMRAGHPKFARVFLGLTRPRAGLSGTCFAGDVIALGEGVTRFAVGDAVFGEAGLLFGANASHICFDQDGSLVKKPQSVSYDEAATLCDGALTSWHFLTRIARLQPGERVLILGGSGSLGTAAIQFAKALGARVTASASARNAELLTSLGADQVVDYACEDPLKRTETYDVIFDTLGVSSFGAARSALTRHGRFICPVLGFRLLRDMVLTGWTRGKTARFAAAGLATPAVHREELSDILALMANDHFAPVMDRTYPLADLVEAHRYVETGRKRGNVVVV